MATRIYSWKKSCSQPGNFPGSRLLYTSLTVVFYFQGHAAPVLYASWAEAGLYSADYLNNLRKIDCELEGHPVPVRIKKYHYFKWIFYVHLVKEI